MLTYTLKKYSYKLKKNVKIPIIFKLINTFQDITSNITSLKIRINKSQYFNR